MIRLLVTGAREGETLPAGVARAVVGGSTEGCGPKASAGDKVSGGSTTM